MTRAWQHCNYFLTSKNHEKFWDTDYLNQLVTKYDIVYLAIGRHTGLTTGYEHVHIDVEFEKKKAWTVIKDIFEDETINVQKRIAERAVADRYLAKEGPERFRVIVNKKPANFQGKRNDITAFDEDMYAGMSWDDLKVAHPSYTGRCRVAYQRYLEHSAAKNKRFRRDPGAQCRVICYFGRSGSGKTWAATGHPAFAKELEGTGEYEEIGVEIAYPGHGTLWWDGVTPSTECLLLDEFSGAWMEFSKFCNMVGQIKGRKFGVKGAFITATINTWIITSIKHPNEWWANAAEFERNRQQLWRRITECYWVDEPNEETGEWGQPILLDKKKFSEMSTETFLNWLKFGRRKYIELYGCEYYYVY
ncbi:putative replicase protein [Dromedary stool-associated circular ssDNA virus]|uniref:putative replicase protein n=1 Tax=Dromedary stool-associated circular ssDNA virus TaxID=1574422 RepID=UPI000540CBDE|nr:putative replicase protein [Dromedary stool-associated circular ssDNA virus]AIY31229.1 putative replicase protein [Dromedary stool-associated circular ssDNA virus]